MTKRGKQASRKAAARKIGMLEVLKIVSIMVDTINPESILKSGNLRQS